MNTSEDKLLRVSKEKRQTTAFEVQAPKMLFAQPCGGSRWLEAALPPSASALLANDTSPCPGVKNVKMCVFLNLKKKDQETGIVVLVGGLPQELQQNTGPTEYRSF